MKEYTVTVMEKFKTILRIIGIYVAIYTVYSFCFVGLFHTPLFDEINVFMYRGIIFIIITGILSALTMGIIRHFYKKLDVRDIIMMFVIFCCVNTVLFVLIPVTIERSVSVFMLSYMEENEDRTFTEDEIAEIFVDKYVYEYGAFDKRFSEQVTTGTIKENEDGTYSLTPAGENIVNMFRIVSGAFNTDQRLVYPVKDNSLNS